MAKSNPLTVTAIVDQHSGTITAFFDKFPGLVVQGSTSDDVKKKLGRLMKSFQAWLSSQDQDLQIKLETLA